MGPKKNPDDPTWIPPSPAHPHSPAPAHPHSPAAKSHDLSSKEKCTFVNPAADFCNSLLKN